MDAKAFISGSETALEELISKMTPPLMKYSYNILLNYSDAEDAVQNAFVKTYLGRAAIRDPETLNSYLYRTVYNSSIDIIRKRRFLMTQSMIRHNESTYISEEMSAALGKLQPQDRALVYNRVIDEMGYTELAEIYGKSEQNLRKRFERAKKKLANLLRPVETAEIADTSKGVI